jgi:hypothetical protein
MVTVRDVAFWVAMAAAAMLLPFALAELVERARRDG